MKGKYQNSSVWVKLLQWLGVTALLTIVAMVLWTLTTTDQHSIAALKWLQFVQTMATFLLPPLICAYLWNNRPAQWLGLTPKHLSWTVWLGAVVLIMVALPAINLMADWNSRMVLPEFLAGVEAWMKAQEEAAMALTQQFLQGTTVWTLLGNIVLMALLPALAEELTFRGVLLGLMDNSRQSAQPNLGRRQHIAIWLTAIIFSAIHMQFYGFVPRMVLGALFGYALYWTGTLWIPVLMHFTNNAVTVIAYWCIYRKGIDPDTLDSFGTGDTAWVGYLSLLLCAAIITAVVKMKPAKHDARGI